MIEAKLTRDTEMFSKMDPFCEIKFASKKYRTKTKSEGGKKPKWNQGFDLFMSNPNEEIEITVYDEDMMTNDLVGFTKVPIGSLIDRVQAWHPIYYKNK